MSMVEASDVVLALSPGERGNESRRSRMARGCLLVLVEIRRGVQGRGAVVSLVFDWW